MWDGAWIDEKAQEASGVSSDLDQAKSAVLNTLSSADAQRGYWHAIGEFVEWYCSEKKD